MTNKDESAKVCDFPDPFHQDHARILATHIASNTKWYMEQPEEVHEWPGDRLYPRSTVRPLGQSRDAWFSTVYQLCKGMIDHLSEIANGQRDLVAEAMAVRNEPIRIIQPEPTTVRECLRLAWRAVKLGKW